MDIFLGISIYVLIVVILYLICSNVKLTRENQNLLKDNECLESKLEASQERCKHSEYLLEESRENNSCLFSDYLKLHDDFTTLKLKSKGKVKK